MDLNNENKHAELTPQTRQEERQLRIESEGVAMVMGPGAGIFVSPGVSIRVGGATIHGGQYFGGDRPAVLRGPGTQLVTVWISFVFSTNGEPVMPFLSNAAAQIERIVNDLAAI